MKLYKIEQMRKDCENGDVDCHTCKYSKMCYDLDSQYNKIIIPYKIPTRLLKHYIDNSKYNY